MVTNQALYINGEVFSGLQYFSGIYTFSSLPRDSQEYLAPSNLDLPEVGRLLCGAPQMSSILLRNASESPVFRM